MAEAMSTAGRARRIAVIRRDGIGQDTVPEGIEVSEGVARRHGLDLDGFDVSSDGYDARHGRMRPEDWQERIGGRDAIVFGVVVASNLFGDIVPAIERSLAGPRTRDLGGSADSATCGDAVLAMLG